jgi:hypothetical protein
LLTASEVEDISPKVTLAQQSTRRIKMFTTKLAASLIITFLFACSTAYGQDQNYKELWECRFLAKEESKLIKKYTLFHIREAYQSRIVFSIAALQSSSGEGFKLAGNFLEWMCTKATKTEKPKRYLEFNDYDKRIPTAKVFENG